MSNCRREKQGAFGMKDEKSQMAWQAALRFAGPAGIKSCVSYGNGHINDTFLVTSGSRRNPDAGRTESDRIQGFTEENSFILQKINTHVFKKPTEVMENMVGVTGWIRHRLEADGADWHRRVLEIIQTDGGKPFFEDLSGGFWRAVRLISNAVCYEQAPSEEVFYQSAAAFGNFQHLLSDYPVKRLHETIPDFHNTPVRCRQFLDALRKDPFGRLAGASQEAGFLQERIETLSSPLTDAAKRGILPLRVTHNDTKLNNVMMDRETGEGLCVIDLDTVMPGLSVTDFGDAIRFGASTAAEDERDLQKVHFDRRLYEVYREGFIEGCAGSLTDGELDLLPVGAMVITYEQALRFLTDYLMGDVYYKTARPEHNLDRARTQIRLLSEMEQVLKTGMTG